MANVQQINSWEELASLEAVWNSLADGMPLRSWDWLGTWWKHYGGIDRERSGCTARDAERQLNVLVVQSEVEGSGVSCTGKVIGIAPLYLDRTIIKGNVLRWLGSGEVCTDHVSLVCRPEHQTDVARAIAEALTTSCNDWDRLDLNAVDADDEAVQELTSRLEERDCLVSRHAADSCWILDLPASWDDYLASISKSHRKQLRQLERRVLESDRARWHQAKSLQELGPAWEILVDLHQRRRRSLGEPGCFASRLFHDFHREIVERLLAKGQLRLSWLELDGTPAAAEYHLAGAATTYAYQGGVDPDRLQEEPGRLSTILCLRAAIEEGHQHIDFLRGDEPYKAHWRAVPHQTFDYRVVPNRRLARLRGQVLYATDVLTGWMRQRQN